MAIDCEKLKLVLNKYLGGNIISDNFIDIENEIKYNISIKFSKVKRSQTRRVIMRKAYF